MERNLASNHLAGQTAGELDRVRQVWMQGKVAAASGHLGEARAALEDVRREFTAREMPYDCALVTLELAALLLNSGSTHEVRKLAVETDWILKAQGIHSEAVAALTLFCQTAANETLTAGLARRLFAFVTQARKNPQLRFEA